MTLAFIFCRYNIYLRVNTVINKALKKGPEFAKLDGIFLPKKSRRVLNKTQKKKKRVLHKPTVVKSKKRAKTRQGKYENVALNSFLDSQCSISAFLSLNSQSQDDGAAPSSKSSTHGHDSLLTPLSSPMKRILPLTPSTLQNLPLTQVSANPSPCSQPSQVSPRLSQAEQRDTTFKSLLPMAQSVLSTVAEAADFPVAHTDEQLTDALSRAVTAAQRLHDALLAASAAQSFCNYNNI